MFPCRIQVKISIQSTEVGEEVHLVAQTLSAAELKASRPQGYGDVRLSRHPPGSLGPASLTQAHRLLGGQWARSSFLSVIRPPATRWPVFFPFLPALEQEKPCSSVSKGSATPF